MIESLLNNLIIPAFFFCENENRNYEVVDGQQRLNTILKFHNNDLTMTDDAKTSYIAPQATYYSGQKYKGLNINRTYE